MRTAAQLAGATAAARAAGERVGLVPTMGALHAGHRSLIDAAVSSGQVAVVSVFVNPLQFGEPADLERYPRDLPADAEIAAQAGAAIVFAPAVEELYPPPVRTTVHVAGLGDVLEGASRPGHFDGVVTVLARLFSLAGPCTAYFGEKDFQQLTVVRTLVRELHLPVELVACPTVREPDGLALSSRNRLLSASGRRAAPALFRALTAGAAAIERGSADPGVVAAEMSSVLAAEGGLTPDYAAVADPESLEEPASISAPVRLLVAARIEGIRLIDNCAASPPG